MLGGRHEKEGFRHLWRKVKAPDQPDEVRLVLFSVTETTTQCSQV